MYAVGKGVQQNYRDAGKWFLIATGAANPRAAIDYAGSLSQRHKQSPHRPVGGLEQVPRRPPGVLARSRAVTRPLSPP
jgi:TPR repeat protein